MVYGTQGCQCFRWLSARAETLLTPNLILPFFPSQRLGIKLTTGCFYPCTIKAPMHSTMGQVKAALLLVRGFCGSTSIHRF